MIIDPDSYKQLQLAVASHYNIKANTEWDSILRNQDIQWRNLVGSASSRGLAPLLYGSIPDLIRESLPQELFTFLTDSYYDSVSFNMLLLNELKDVANLISGRQIPVILLKGAGYLVSTYSSLALRPMVDLDLLIDHRDLETTLEELQGSGYRLQQFPPFPDRDGLFWNETLLVKDSPSNLQIELHWNLIDYPTLALKLPASLLFERSQIVEYDNHNYRILSPADQIIHLCIHNTYNHRNQLTRTFVDIAMIIENYKYNIDWDQLIQTTVKCSISQAVVSNLKEASEEWYASIPSAVVSELARMPTSYFESIAIFSQRSEFLKLLRTLISLPGFKSKFEFFKGQLVPSYEFLVWRYGNGIHTPTRLSLLIKRYVSGLQGLLREIWFWSPGSNQRDKKKHLDINN